MMVLKERINSFVRLGEIIREGIQDDGNDFPKVLQEAKDAAMTQNPWFTKKNLHIALTSVAASLDSGKLVRWIEPYSQRIEMISDPKTIGIVMAGNIPLAGFHDFLCVLLSGHRLHAKLSSADKFLLPALAEILIRIQPEWRKYIGFTNEKLSGFDAVIATGSNNTSFYFEYYFRKYPHIIRKNRNGIAVVTGNEKENELEALADDVFLFFGMGCRNVSKVFLPAGYDTSLLISAFRNFEEYQYHHKYRNNYEYYKSIFLINKTPFIDNGFLLMTGNSAISSPVSVLYYGFYDKIQYLEKELSLLLDEIQCIVCHRPLNLAHVLPGHTQYPELWDYADGIDTMSFLISL